MAGETVRSDALCLAIRPWSRTSHVVSWLTPGGRVTTLVKGAVRPKSAFLGQYDLNYTCEIIYYARAKNELHALRECSPRERRDSLRGSFRALALADYFRKLAYELAPFGPDCADWHALLSDALDALAGDAPLPPGARAASALQRLIAFEMSVLELAGLSPEMTEAAGKGGFQLRGERRMPVSAEVYACLKSPYSEKNPKILLDAARVIGVFYAFHLNCAGDVRRTVLGLISENEVQNEGKEKV